MEEWIIMKEGNRHCNHLWESHFTEEGGQQVCERCGRVVEVPTFEGKNV